MARTHQMPLTHWREAQSAVSEPGFDQCVDEWLTERAQDEAGDGHSSWQAAR